MLKCCGSDENTKKEYDASVQEMMTSGNCDAMDQFITKFNSRYPNNGIFEAPLKRAMTKEITKNCLNNFTYNGFADGYRIESGKLKPSEFSLACIHLIQSINMYRLINLPSL